MQRHREAVHLYVGEKVELCGFVVVGFCPGADDFAVALRPVANFRFGKNVGERNHAFVVADLFELIERLSGDALSRRVGRD